MHEKNECTLQQSPKRNDGVPYPVHSKDIMIKKKAADTQTGQCGGEGKQENVGPWQSRGNR